MSWAYVWYRKGGRLAPGEIAQHMAGYALRMVGAQDLSSRPTAP